VWKNRQTKQNATENPTQATSVGVDNKQTNEQTNVLENNKMLYKTSVGESSAATENPRDAPRY